MVFKRVLKGIGRLMLTTAVMCGVGLFLCSSEVKAAVDVNASEAEGNFTVTVEIQQNDDISEIKDEYKFDKELENCAYNRITDVSVVDIKISYN